MEHIAKIVFSEAEGRHELYIDDRLKAYTTDATDESKQELQQLAQDKGYKVEIID